MKTFIDKFLFNELPEFVVLQCHGRSSLDEVVKRLGTVAIQGGQLLLDHGKNDLPEALVSFQLILSNHPEAVCNLEVSHLLAVPLVYINKVVSVLASTECKVDLVEDEAVVVVEVVVASGMHHTSLHLDHLSCCKALAGDSASAQTSEQESTLVQSVHFLLLLYLS